MEQGQADRVTRHPLLHALSSLMLPHLSCGVDQSAGCSAEMFPMITFYGFGELTSSLLGSAFLGHCLLLCLFIFGATFSDAVCTGCFSMALCAFTGHSQTEKTTGKYSSNKHQTGFVVCVVCLSFSLPPLLFLLVSLFWSATLAFCNR